MPFLDVKGPFMGFWWKGHTGLSHGLAYGVLRAAVGVGPRGLRFLIGPDMSLKHLRACEGFEGFEGWDTLCNAVGWGRDAGADVLFFGGDCLCSFPAGSFFMALCALGLAVLASASLLA